MILIGCEESQTVCQAFRSLGYEAFSCDILPTRGNDEWHLQGRIEYMVQIANWDLVILHPDCTHLAVSGNRWYGKGTPGYEKRLEAILWTYRLWETTKKHTRMAVLENPVSVIFQHLNYDELQYIQPWQFGHRETKKTGLALHNVPPLTPTRIVDGRKQRVFKMPETPDRKRLRSITYKGVAEAMASQWGPLTEIRNRR